MAELDPPIIVKKIVKADDVPHGGAWKVAYADFVTAMMAFFLMLWLISAASNGALDLEGIADYFTPTIGLKDSAGIGFEGGDSNEVEDGTKKNTLTRPGIVMGQTPQGIKVGQPKKRVVVESPEGEDLLFQQRGRAIKEMFSTDVMAGEYRDNVKVEQTPEGLKIQLLDSDKDNMFQPGNVKLTKMGKFLVERMTDIIRGMPNHIAVIGHTDAVPFKGRRNYSNWELSTGRANSARRYMMERGMLEERIGKIEGRADRELLLPETPKDAKNRRIEIILLRGSHLDYGTNTTPLSGVLPVQDANPEILNFEDTGINDATREIKETPRTVPAPGRPTAPPSSPSDALEYAP